MILSRVLSVLSAMCLVAAFTAATVLSPTESLALFIAERNHPLLVVMKGIIQSRSDWLWQWVVVPVLERPVWLVPVALGLVLLGAVVTLGSRKGCRSSTASGVEAGVGRRQTRRIDRAVAMTR